MRIVPRARLQLKKQIQHHTLKVRYPCLANTQKPKKNEHQLEKQNVDWRKVRLWLLENDLIGNKMKINRPKQVGIRSWILGRYHWILLMKNTFKSNPSIICRRRHTAQWFTAFLSRFLSWIDQKRRQSREPPDATQAEWFGNEDRSKKFHKPHEKASLVQGLHQKLLK